ncbi:hypothetical protein [Leptolyngbya phage Lbo-JY46]
MSNQVPLIKILKKTQSKLDMVVQIVTVYCFLSQIKISETDIKVMSYFIIYGINEKTKKLIVDSKLLNADSIKNSMSRLRKLGLIHKSEFRRKEDYIKKELDISVEDIIGMMIKIDNT